MDLEEAIHYLDVLLKNGSVFQPEIREALEFAILMLLKVRDG